MNKTPICSIVALDILDYAKKTNAEQIEIKHLLKGFIQLAVIDIPQDDRLIVDTLSGVAIACSGPLEDALEDALFISITIRDEILKHNTHNSTALYVQFGINLGAAHVVKNAMVGEGIAEAQRIMSFAKPNQILVSSVYYEMASKLTQEIAQMFEKYEMHAHEHDVYAVRLLKETTAAELATNAESNVLEAPSIASKINWRNISLGVLTLAAFFVLAKLVAPPIEPAITLEQPVVATPQAPTALTVEPNQAAQKQDAATQDDANKATKKNTDVTQKKTKLKASVEAQQATSKTEKSQASAVAGPVNSKISKDNTNDKSGWQTFKDSVTSGTDNKCTQAEIALNQCAK